MSQELESERLKEENKKLHRAYRVIADLPEGKVVLRDLRKFCQYDDELFVPGNPDYTSYNCGKRRVFLRFKQMAKLSPDEIEKIIQESVS